MIVVIPASSERYFCSVLCSGTSFLQAHALFFFKSRCGRGKFGAISVQDLTAKFNKFFNYIVHLMKNLPERERHFAILSLQTLQR